MNKLLSFIHSRIGWIVHYMPSFIGNPLSRILYRAWAKENQ